MKVILEGNGRLVIDIIPSGGAAGWTAERDASKAPKRRRTRWRRDREATTGELFHVDAFASAEEALFAGLMFVLRRYQQRSGQAPTHEVLTAVMRTMGDLLMSGDLPPPGAWDRRFLAMLLVVLEQVAGRHDIRWLDGLIRDVRATIVDADQPHHGNDADDSRDNGSQDVGTTSGGNGIPTRRTPPVNPKAGKAERSRRWVGRTTEEARRAAAGHSDTWRAGSSRVKTYDSAEQALFGVLMFLLQCYQEDARQAPTQEIMIATVRALEVLLKAGKLPQSGAWDRTFLSLLQTGLEQIATLHGVEWLDDLISEVRARAEHQRAHNDDDGNGGDDSGSGEPGPLGDAGDSGTNRDGRKSPNKGNGVPSREDAPGNGKQEKKKS